MEFSLDKRAVTGPRFLSDLKPPALRSIKKKKKCSGSVDNDGQFQERYNWSTGQKATGLKHKGTLCIHLCPGAGTGKGGDTNKPSTPSVPPQPKERMTKETILIIRIFTRSRVASPPLISLHKSHFSFPPFYSYQGDAFVKSRTSAMDIFTMVHFDQSIYIQALGRWRHTCLCVSRTLFVLAADHWPLCFGVIFTMYYLVKIDRKRNDFVGATLAVFSLFKKKSSLLMTHIFSPP